MKWTAVLVFFAVLFVGACQSISIDPEDPSAQTIIREYLQAKAERSCERVRKLTDSEDFPLPELLRLRREDFCDETVNVGSYPAWLQPLAVEVAITQAEKRGEALALLDLYLQRSKENLPQFEKLNWTKKALEVARQLKDPELLKSVEDRAEMIAPRLKKNPKPEEIPDVADDFRLNRDFQKAIGLYRDVIGKPSYSTGEKIAAFKGIRTAHKNARKLEAHIVANANLIKYLESQVRKNKTDTWIQQQLLDARIYQARAVWTQGRPAQALQQIAWVKKHLKSLSLAEVLWLEARIYEERKDLKHANILLEQALQQEIKDPEFKDKILWNWAWNEKNLKNHSKALELLSTMATETKNDFTRYRARFWQGRIQKQIGEEDDAKNTWIQLAAQDPLGYYGLLAHNELDKPIQKPKVSIKTRLTWEVQKQLREILKTEIPEWLISLKETELLPHYLDSVVGKYQKHENQSDEVWLRILKYYAAGGLYLKLFEKMSQISPQQRALILENHPELLFPQPWKDDVRTASEKTGISPELIYAIMRQESAFNPQARSGADAFGLMQLLPEVSRELSRKHKLEWGGKEDLYIPEKNIMLGAVLLKDQMKKYNDRFILAVASYNANEPAIANWLKLRFRGDSLEFIEDIPYEETRSYIRLVIRNMIYYQLLNTNETELPFPKSVLHM